MTGRVLVARLDNLGDVLLSGPAVRAVAAHADYVALLAGPRGRAAAELLPGVDEVLEFCAPWIDPDPPELTAESMDALTKQIRDLRLDSALILTSFHQSPLPLALVLRMAGVPWIGGICEDYPGALLDLRHRVDGDPPETERALSLVRAAGYDLPRGADSSLAVRRPLPPAPDSGPPGYVVVHPAASVPARQPTAQRSRAIVCALVEAGHRVVVTGAARDRDLTATVTHGLDPARVANVSGTTTLGELAAMFADADVVIAPNTGPAHVAAAVGTPVVSLFAPVVSAARWAPYGVPAVVLGDQNAPCSGSRAQHCPIPGHPCLAIDPREVVRAVRALSPQRHDRGEKEDTGGVL